jgi:hypothetical protein
LAIYLELRNGHASIGNLPEYQGSLGPVLGPFLGVRLSRDEIRLITTGPEVALQRVADWVIYDNMYFAEIEIISVDQVGPRRKLRLRAFDPQLAATPGCSIPRQN